MVAMLLNTRNDIVNMILLITFYFFLLITWMRRNDAVVSPFSVICETPPRGES